MLGQRGRWGSICPLSRAVYFEKSQRKNTWIPEEGNESPLARTTEDLEEAREEEVRGGWSSFVCFRSQPPLPRLQRKLPLWARAPLSLLPAEVVRMCKQPRIYTKAQPRSGLYRNNSGYSDLCSPHTLPKNKSQAINMKLALLFNMETNKTNCPSYMQFF